jgi:hypothetical protein
VHPTDYYAGYQYYPDETEAASRISSIFSNGPWESYDGINMTCCASQPLAPAGSFTLIPPTYTWRERGYKEPGVDKWTNWQVTIDGVTWDDYCTIDVQSDVAPYQEISPGDCDGNENTDHPGLPYPGSLM